MYQVSILVPVYGVEKYIERCARSLFEQTYDNLEYIFVDDCTEDKSIEILKRVMEDFPARKEQVHILHHERNRGLAAARNTALDAATSPFVSHVDSDDYLDRNAIRLLVEKQVETGADIVSGNYYTINRNGFKESFNINYYDKHSMLLKVFDRRSPSRFVWGRLIRLTLYNDHQIRAKEGINNGEDWQQTPILVYYADTIAKIDNSIYYYDRTNEHSYTSESRNNQNTELWIQSMESINIMESFFLEHGCEFKEEAHRLAIYGWDNILRLSATYRKKDLFNEVKKKILTCYADCLDEIGWGNNLNRYYRCNYTIFGCCCRLYDYCRKLLMPQSRKICADPCDCWR
jgi:glycosyltransferase involved in cell wall biosynthesis